MEVILSWGPLGDVVGGILHVCGGDPVDYQSNDRLEHVFSTYVEVILLNLQRLNRIQSILHVCGGDPLVQ